MNQMPEFAEQIKGLKKQGMEVLVEEEIFMQKAKSLNLIPEQSELDKQGYRNNRY